MANQQLYLQMKTFLQQTYQGQNQQVSDPLLKTLAMMVTGVILFQLGWRWLYRLLALDRLHELQIVFRWDIKLPPPSFHPAI